MSCTLKVTMKGNEVIKVEGYNCKRY
ncbi:hypothetical protein [Pseudothermotoga thermarum]